MTLSLRPVTVADWPHVHQLLLNTPMSATLPLVIARSRDPALAHPSLDGDQIELGAWQDERLAGYIHMQVETRRLLVDGQLQPRRVGFVGDLRVAKVARRSGVALQLIAELIREARARGAEAAVCLVNEGNAPMLQVLERGHGGLRCETLRTYTTASRLILSRPRSRRAPSLVPVTPDDAALGTLSESLAHRFLAPAFTPEILRRLIGRYPELRFFRRAEGPPEIVCAVWDPSRARRLLLKELPRPLRALQLFWNVARRFTRAHPFPAAGEAWRCAEVSFAVRERLSPDDEAAIASAAWDAGCHAFNLIESGLEPPPDGLRVRGPAYRMRTHLLGLGVDGVPPPPCPPDLPVHLDLGFL